MTVWMNLKMKKNETVTGSQELLHQRVRRKKLFMNFNKTLRGVRKRKSIEVKILFQDQRVILQYIKATWRLLRSSVCNPVDGRECSLHIHQCLLANNRVLLNLSGIHFLQ